MAKVGSLTIAPQTGSDAYYASWTWPKNHTKHYAYHWYYSTGDGVWFSGAKSTTTSKNCLYTPPDNAKNIKINVRPVSTTHKVNDKDTNYWTATLATKTLNIVSHTPANIAVPTLDANKYELAASLNNVTDANTQGIQFQILRISTGNTSSIICVKKNNAASTKWTLRAGATYKVRARGVYNPSGKSKVYGSWSNYTEIVTAPPATPTGFKAVALSATSAKVSWDTMATATEYIVEYTQNRDYFDSNPDEVESVTVTVTHAEITGMESGHRYFFRVRAVNDSGESGWFTNSKDYKFIIGEAPASPTIWTDFSTGVIGDDLSFYGKHNSRDGSVWNRAEFAYKLNGADWVSEIILNLDTEIESVIEKVMSTDTLNDGDVIQWRMRTRGILNEFGDWSGIKQVNLFAPPSLSLRIEDGNAEEIETVTEYPFYIHGEVFPDSAIGYALSVVSNGEYEIFDEVGERQVITKGEEIFNKYYVYSGNFEIEFMPQDIALMDGASYTAKVTAAMASGLTAEAEAEFDVDLDSTEYEPDIEITYDDDTYSVYLHPYVVDDNDDYVPNIKLSVYRRDFDGGFTPIIENIDNTPGLYVTDPHPALDYARYRIVAIDQLTGSISYYDAPGYPINCQSIIIQWDEDYLTYFETEEESAFEDSVISTSILELPYSITINEGNNLDVKTIEYIGRKHPVSYYGTQVGGSATWSFEVRRDDMDTISKLRRLFEYSGDVYVREPSGSGYWATLKGTINQLHNKSMAPISINITRVEGGV